MRNKYGIGFFATAIIAMLVITCAYQFSFHKAKEQAEKIHAQKEQQEIEEESGALVEADGKAMKEDCYYLMEVNGYVVVYLSDKVTPYEYTAIAYDELPPLFELRCAMGNIQNRRKNSMVFWKTTPVERTGGLLNSDSVR